MCVLNHKIYYIFSLSLVIFKELNFNHHRHHHHCLWPAFIIHMYGKLENFCHQNCHFFFLSVFLSGTLTSVICDPNTFFFNDDDKMEIFFSFYSVRLGQETERKHQDWKKKFHHTTIRIRLIFGSKMNWPQVIIVLVTCHKFIAKKNLLQMVES